MKRGKIKIKAVRRSEPEIRLFVLALLELARQQQAEEDLTKQAPSSSPASEEDDDV